MEEAEHRERKCSEESLELLGDIESERDESWRGVAPPVAGMAVGLATLGAGVSGIVARLSPEGMPNMFAGVMAAGALVFVLMIPILWGRIARGGGKCACGRNASGLEAKKVWSKTAEQVCAELRVCSRVGLSHVEADERFMQHGANEAALHADPGYLSFFVKKIYEPTQLLLLSVGVLYLAFSSLKEASTAFVAILLMVIAEVKSDWRAKRALKGLKHSAPAAATVKREGQRVLMDAASVVPGDIVLLDVGMEVPADLRLIRSHFLSLDQSRLTGEAAPVAKDAFQVLSADTPMLYRCNVAMAGSLVTRGRGVGVVWQTGVSTTRSQVANVTCRSQEKETKLQKVMKEVAFKLLAWALLLSLVGALLALWNGTRWQDVILTGLSLAFVSIPVQLPILTLAVLAVGAAALSQRFMYVKQLRVAEILGSVDTIIVDKTGTLTQNRLLWHSAYLGLQQYEIRSRVMSFRRKFDGRGFEKILEAWLVMSYIGDGVEDIETQPQSEIGSHSGSATDGCGNTSEVDVDVDVDRAAETSPHFESADGFDQAILFALGSWVSFLGGHPGFGLLLANPKFKDYLEKVYACKLHATFLGEVPFDATLQFSSRTLQIARPFANPVNEDDLPEQVVYFKGAPDVFVKYCTYAVDDGTVVPIDNRRSRFEDLIAEAASHGFRLIGFASKSIECSDGEEHLNTDKDGIRSRSILEGATFLGFFSFVDPVREGAAAAVSECQEAGTRLLLVTEDHLETAVAVAKQVGIITKQRGFDATRVAISCADISLSGLEKEERQAVVMNKNVFAMATSADKLLILDALQGHAKCVLATGDGVGDVPILTQADVGVAMGTGTDVAREAAALVLMDNNFKLIPFSLAEGRRLLDNLRKALAFYLGAKVGLILLFVFGTMMGRAPLSAIQIIASELFVELGASTTFVMEPADHDIMKRKPRSSDQRFFDPEMLAWILASGATMAVAVLASFAFALLNNPAAAQTCAFLTWVFVQALMAFNLRTFRQPVFQKGIFCNVGMLIWLLATTAVASIILYSQFVQTSLVLVQLSLKEFLVTAFASLMGACLIELGKWVVPVLQNSTVVSHFQTRAESRKGQSLLTAQERLPLTQSA